MNFYNWYILCKIVYKLWDINTAFLLHIHITGAGHIIRISSKRFISLIPFKKWNLYNVYIHSTQTDIFQVFISFNFDDYNWQLMKTPNSVSQKIWILWKGSQYSRREGKDVVEKSVQAIGITAPWRGLWNKTHSKMWGRFTKSGLQLESVLQEPLRTDVCKTWVSAVTFLVSSLSWTTDSVRSVSPGLKTKRTGLLLSGLKLCSLIKVNFAFPLEIRAQSLEEERRGTESTLLEVQCKVSTVSDGLGCHVIYWCWSTVFSEVQGQHSRIPGSFRALHASCCWPTLWRCRFHFPTGLGTCIQCQSYQYLV